MTSGKPVEDEIEAGRDERAREALATLEAALDGDGAAMPEPAVLKTLVTRLRDAVGKV